MTVIIELDRSFIIHATGRCIHIAIDFSHHFTSPLTSFKTFYVLIFWHQIRVCWNNFGHKFDNYDSVCKLLTFQLMTNFAKKSNLCFESFQWKFFGDFFGNSSPSLRKAINWLLLDCQTKNTLGLKVRTFCHIRPQMAWRGFSPSIFYMLEHHFNMSGSK